MLPLKEINPLPSSHLELSPQKKGTIGVMALQFDGFGDIIGGMQIGKMVERLFPDYDVIFSVVQPHFSSLEISMMQPLTRHELTQEKLQTFTHLKTCKESDFLKKVKDLSCLIIFPTYHDSLIPVSIIDSKVPLIKLREYGSGQPTRGTVQGKAYPLGLNQGELGIILDKDLYEYGQQHKNDSSLQRLKHLESLPPVLSKLILGSDFHLDKIAQFDQTAKLYSGYGNLDDTLIDFINTLCEFDQTQRVAICLLTNPVEGISNKLQKTFYQQGFKDIAIHSIDATGKVATKNFRFKDKAKGQRQLTLIFTKLSHPQAIALSKASEPQTLATGDQSFLEMLLLHKLPLYDCRHHKIAFVHSLIQLINKKNQKIGTLIQKAIFGPFDPLKLLKTLDLRMEVERPFLKTSMVHYFKSMQESKALKQSWSQIIQDLYENYNPDKPLQNTYFR